MPEEKNILELVENHAIQVLTNEVPAQFCYHNLDHTKAVVEAATEIAIAEKLDPSMREWIAIAAWFHDLGYSKSAEHHEKMSAELAEQFLAAIDYPADKIERVKDCILATVMPQQPKGKDEEVLCDADLYHLSTSEFKERSKLLRKEWQSSTDKSFDNKDWRKLNFEFLKSQSYFTAYAKEHFEEGKLQNLMTIKKEIKSKKKAKQKASLLALENKKLKEKLAKAKDNIPTRGIETMFRTTSKNHIELSAMADNKANIMISINSIILSIIISVLIRKLEEYPHFVIPTVMLTTVCLVTIVLSILTTRPNISKGKFTKKDINNKKTNLLFFGNFHKMSLEEYEWGMNELMKDGHYLYGSLIKDIYFLGAVLGKKYKRLRMAYTIFMFGFVIAVLSFMIAEVFFKSHYMY